MRKIFLLIVALLATAGIVSAKDKVIEPSQLPELAQKVLNAYFTNDGVAYVKMESGFFENTEYDVRLASGTEIDFDQAGNWIKVDCGTRRVPDEMLPDAVKAYVRDRGAGAYVTEIERSLNGKCEIELSDGIEVKFNADGNVAKIETRH